MKTLFAMTIAALPLLLPGAALAQSGSMMNAGNWGGGWMAGVGALGGYAGAWMPVLPFVALVVLVALVITQKRK